MAAILVNDLGGNPWVLAEAGTASTKNVKVYEFSFHEWDHPDHIAEVVDNDGRLVARLTPTHPTKRHYGWVKGLKMDVLNSGYVLASLMTGGA